MSRYEEFMERERKKKEYHSKIAGISQPKLNAATSIAQKNGWLVLDKVDQKNKYAERNKMPKEEWIKKWNGVPPSYWVCGVCQKRCKSQVEFWQHFKARHPEVHSIIALSL